MWKVWLFQNEETSNRIMTSARASTLSCKDPTIPFHQALTSLTQQDARQVQWQAELKRDDWVYVQTAITRLFQLGKYPDLASDLPVLNEKLIELSKSKVGPFLGEFYQDQLLKKCMIILRQEVKEEKDAVLLEKLSQIWTQFYTCPSCQHSKYSLLPYRSRACRFMP